MKKWSWPSIFRIVLSLVLLKLRLGQAMSKSRLTLAHLYRPTRLRRNSPREKDRLACRRFRWMRGLTGSSVGQRNKIVSRETTNATSFLRVPSPTLRVGKGGLPPLPRARITSVLCKYFPSQSGVVVLAEY